ncbi:MAG: ABC transporter permease [Planctomycetes bacterium]|nr:ABC transporter permease [Planctomycetota bacterium]
MIAYILRRLLWMIPTFLGILMITFGVMRLQSNSLSQEMEKASGGEGGVMDAKLMATGVENYLARFRSTGLDLPALVNLRGFTTKEKVVDKLRRTARGPGVSEHRRNRLETDLWLEGHFLVEPLAQIIADDALAELHGPASLALSLCAYYPLNPDDLKRLSQEEQRRRQTRNFEVRSLRIDYVNTEKGFSTTDTDGAKKRATVAEFWKRNADSFSRSSQRWGAILGETGFCEVMGKLFTGNLFSVKRKEYVFNVISDRWKVSFTINLLSIIIAWCISVPLGIRSARRIGTIEDQVTTNALFLLWSLPSFFIGTLLLHHLCTDTASGRAWFPNRGLSSQDALWMSTPRYLLDLAWHGFLPLSVLCYASFTSLSRYMRADMLEQLRSDYVRTARAKGADEDHVVYRHALRNSMVTMITLGAGLLSELFGGFVIVEYIFSIPGLGSLLVEAAREQDAPLIMGSTVISVGLLLVGILIADVLYAVVDPRVRSRYG